MNEVKIANQIVGPKHEVKFIAELGVNHLGNFEIAKKMIDSAIEAGSDFLKFQTYIAEERYDKKNPKYDEFTKLLKEWQLSREEEIEMWQLAKNLGAEVFTSVYENKSIEFTEKMGKCNEEINKVLLSNNYTYDDILEIMKIYSSDKIRTK